MRIHWVQADVPSVTTVFTPTKSGRPSDATSLTALGHASARMQRTGSSLWWSQKPSTVRGALMLSVVAVCSAWLGFRITVALYDAPAAFASPVSNTSDIPLQNERRKKAEDASGLPRAAEGAVADVVPERAGALAARMPSRAGSAARAQRPGRPARPTKHTTTLAPAIEEHPTDASEGADLTSLADSLLSTAAISGEVGRATSPAPGGASSDLADASPARPRTAAQTQPSTRATHHTSPTPRQPKAHIEALQVHGALSASTVRRGLERLLPGYAACAAQCPPTDLGCASAVWRVRSQIDETGRSRAAHAECPDHPAQCRCLERVTGQLVVAAPDTGTARLEASVRFSSSAGSH
jgi:hypothetical protein